MKSIEFHAQGIGWSLALGPLSEAPEKPRGARVAARLTGRAAVAPFDPISFVAALRRTHAMRLRVPAADPARLCVVRSQRAEGRRFAAAPAIPGGAMTIVTPTLIVEGARRDDMKAAMNAGARVLHEGFDGKALLAVDGIGQLPRVIALLMKRQVGAVTPNFLRRFERTPLSVAQRAWAHRKIRVARAWAITKGSPQVRVAVLDEGVDTAHPALRAAVVGQRDFIGDKGGSALPDGNDAHDTSCAGIVLARGKTAAGVAPKCSLLAARIAMDDGAGHWVFDDYATADAIDWAWREGAAVLSNSWGGGAPSDAISRAFGRARTQGRGGKGSVVCIAAGNAEAPIDFPGNLPGYVTVGASNPNDERKTRQSSDGENWWGSNYGATMWVLAPGVFIRTTDISGPAGYDPGDYTARFNGTSSAAPHVAAAAALMISANPNLSASDVRMLLATTAKRLPGQQGWTRESGYGRLDAGAAVAAARAHP